MVSLTTMLPEVQAVGLGNEELVALLDSESLVPGVDVRQGSVDTPLTERMRVALYPVTYLLVGNVLAPYTGISDKEALVGSKAVLDLEGLVGSSITIGVERYLQAAMVSQILAQCKATVGLSLIHI